jgi:hypothetical protein
MNKVIRDGWVAVLYSPGYGAGWYTWNDFTHGDELIFDPGLVDLVERSSGDIYEYVKNKWPDAYTGGLEDVRVEWLPVGTQFVIDECDGSESIMIKENYDWKTA